MIRVASAFFLPKIPCIPRSLLSFRSFDTPGNKIWSSIQDPFSGKFSLTLELDQGGILAQESRGS